MSDNYDDGRIKFYYSREKRLERASQAVRDINSGKIPQKKGLFRTLTATKSLTYLFISVITICAAILILSRFQKAQSERKLGNNTVAVSVIGSGENSYITVKKSIQSSGAKNASPLDVYTGPVDVAVSASGEGNPIHVEQLYFGMESEELFRFIAPFRGKKLVILMEAGSEQIHMTVNSE